MQLIITSELSDELVLPINYNHIIQSIIYNNLRNYPEYGTYVHDRGYKSSGRSFKLFTFGMLSGNYRIANKKIIFSDNVSFEVRSPDIMLMKALYENLNKNGIKYGDTLCENTIIRRDDITVEADSITIKMNSPMTVYSTDKLDRKTYFYRPDDIMFSQMINGSFRRKYEACYGTAPLSDIGIQPLRVSERDKTVTNYKGFYIDAWRGIYRLTGKRKYLDFLFQTGLGSKNAQGFGMFDIYNEVGK